MKRTPTTTTARRMQRRRQAAVAAVLVVLAACGGSNDASQPGSAPGDTSTVSQSTSSPATTEPADSPATAAAPPATAAPPPATAPSTSAAPGLEPFESQVEQMLAASLEPGFYTPSAPDLPPGSLPSGTSVGIRLPGQADLIVGVGTEASPPDATFDPAAPFSTGLVTTNIVYALYYMLVEDGTLQPTTTLATWLPSYPNADQITLDMLSDPAGLHGMAALDNWAELVTADFARNWTLEEVLAEAAALPAGAVGEPGSTDTAATALLLVLEESTGMSFGELLDKRLVQPLGLSATTVIDADQLPAGFSHGRFNFPGRGAFSTADLPLNASSSFHIATEGVLSTLADQLAIAEALATGSVPGLGLRPTPDRFPSDREVTDEDGTRYLGDGFPLNLHCACEAVGDGHTGASVGRRGSALGTITHWYHFPATGITIVVHLNSFETGHSLEVMQLAYAIHELVSGEPTPPG